MGAQSALDNIEIIGTDISSSALFIAISGRYNTIEMSRGMPEKYKNRYFTQKGNVWVFDQDLKKKVKFKKFNLMNSFSGLGSFDLILCRYVVIYFSDDSKAVLYKKMSESLKRRGVLIMGATELLRDCSDVFESLYHNKALLYKKK